MKKEKLEVVVEKLLDLMPATLQILARNYIHLYLSKLSEDDVNNIIKTFKEILDFLEDEDKQVVNV